MSLRRILQSFSLLIFVVLLLHAAHPLLPWLPVDAYLRLDPSAFLASSLSARALMPYFTIPILLLVLTATIGRFFCGYLCPMGITIEVTDRLGSHGRKKGAGEPPGGFRPIKYQVLLFILGGASIGISYVFLASPLSLITRLYGTIVHPVACLVGNRALTLIRPLANQLDLTYIAYATLASPRFDLTFFTATLFLVIFALGLVAPRFWCRYLCPSGALFALFSVKPLIRRRVSKRCTDCGLCRERCPMGAIGEDPGSTNHSECIVCLTCQKVCPEAAVSFPMGATRQKAPEEPDSPDRRRLIAAGASGLGAAALSLTSLKHLHGEPGPGNVSNPPIIRPPGALPEQEFLARCIRCGECMKACPTNALQPIGLASGAAAFFSPRVLPRRGHCDRFCNACGHVCPTGAIRPLPLYEKVWAKVGTAHILRQKCLAWEFGKKCLVCDEFCPFDAIEFRMVAGARVPVPVVNETKCSGCGLCEHNCPVQAVPAIVIEPMGALRLKSGSFMREGLRQGLNLSILHKKKGKGSPYGLEGHGISPAQRGLPPGFTR